MTQYEYYKKMQELCVDMVKLKKQDDLSKTTYSHASEGFEIKALKLPMEQAGLPATKDQQKMYERFYTMVQEKKKLENW